VPIHTLKDGEELARRIPDATFTVISNAKHLVQEDAPEAVVAAVLDIWRLQEAAT
jgi:pimeloyl-ACP methyl ester carboxylesterase